MGSFWYRDGIRVLTGGIASRGAGGNAGVNDSTPGPDGRVRVPGSIKGYNEGDPRMIVGVQRDCERRPIGCRVSHLT